MAKKWTFGFLGVGAIGLGVYLFRRHIFGRLLSLPPFHHIATVTHGLDVPMDDGIFLKADLYAPIGERLFPTILIRTPYGRGGHIGLTDVLTSFIAHRFAERGYNVLVQDVRGRYDASTDFEPFIHEAEDGRATLKWLEVQPWFNGVLGMWGQSYLGYVQWAVAGSAPIYLKAIVPAITSSRLPKMVMQERAFALDTFLRWLIDIDAMDRTDWWATLSGLWRFNPQLQDNLVKTAANHLPLNEVDQLVVGKKIPFFQTWLEHPDGLDAYWEKLDHSQNLEHITAAVHLISGWYDIMLPGILDDYMRLRAGQSKPYLTIGPWMHLDIEGTWETLRQGLVWFDAILKGDRSRLRARPVRYFMFGGGGWQETDSWPPPGEEVHYYLGRRSGEKGCLALEPVVEHSNPDIYIYDPYDPTPAAGGALMSRHGGMRDNRKLEARADVLTFTTPPLEKDLEIAGFVRVVLYVKSSQPSADFFCRLCDVYPDGRSLNLCDGLIRVEGETGILQPDGSRRIEFGLSAAANRFGRGHAVRLQVSSGAHARWVRNPGTLESLVTGTQLVAAQQTIYHDRDHPAELVLPTRI